MKKVSLYIQVSNDTFHNGNADAWENILSSYVQKYPYTHISIIFQDEILHSPYQLYRWGKIFNGALITIILKGEILGDIKRLKSLLSIASGRDYKQVLHRMPGWISKFF